MINALHKNKNFGTSNSLKNDKSIHLGSYKVASPIYENISIQYSEIETMNKASLQIHP
jgi:hypothetical protein